MAYRQPSLTLPLGSNPNESRLFRQVALWAAAVTRNLNALGGNADNQASGNAGSLFSTVTFSGSNASINISGEIAQFVTGGTSLATINPPANFSGIFIMIPTTDFFVAPGGNIKPQVAGINCAANQMVICIYDGSNWYIR